MDVRMPDGTLVTNVPDNITQEELLSAYSSYAPPPPASENPIYGVAANITPSLATGIGSLLQTPGKLADLITGTAPGEKAGIGRTMLGALIPGGAKTVQEAGASLEEIGKAAKTIGLQQKEKERAQKIADTEGELAKFGVAFSETLTDPSLISSFLFEQLPNSLGAGVGGIIAKNAGKMLFKNASEKALASMGVSGTVATGAAMQGADVGYETYKDIYQRLVKEGMDPAEANLVAAQKGRVAALEAGGLSYAVSKIPGAREFEKALFKETRQAIPKAGLIGTAKGAAKGAAGEGISEVGEEVGGQFASNIGKQEVFPETDLTTGLGETGAMALLGGVGMGGPSGAINARSQARAQQRLEEELAIKKAADARDAAVAEALKEIAPEQVAPEQVAEQPTQEVFYSEEPLPQEILDQGYKLVGQTEEDGRVYYAYTKEEPVAETVAEPVAEIAAPEAAPVAPELPLGAAPESAEQRALPPVAQPAQPEIVQPELVEQPIAEPVSAEPAQPAQIAQPEIVQPVDPNVEARLAAESVEPVAPSEPPPVAPKKVAKAAAPKAGEKILSAHEFIASLGGLNKKEAVEINPDAAKANVRIGNKWLYASKGGLSASEAAEKLAEAGYIQTEDNNEVYRVINDSLVDPVYSINDADAIAERRFAEQAAEEADRFAKKEAEAGVEAQEISAEARAEQGELQTEESLRQYMLDSGYTEQDLNVVGFTKASPELKAEVVELERQMKALGIDPSSIIADISFESKTDLEYYNRAKSEFAKAITQAAKQGGRGDVSQANVPTPPAELTSPSQEELKAKQEAADKAAADKARADREAEAKAKADAERKEIAARSEKAAAEFELGKTAEEDLTGQKDIFSTLVQISPEQQKIDVLNKLEAALKKVVQPFRAVSATSTSVLRPRPLNDKQIALIRDLASEAIDLGMPASLFKDVSAAGATRMSSVAAIAPKYGWLLLGKDWSSTSRVEKLKSIIHEFGHSVDTEKATISNNAAWQKAHDELKKWYDSSPVKKEHPLAYPFDKQFDGKVRIRAESFAQSLALYFVSPVELQTNAPDAYLQIQSIVEGIQNESQRASAASATKTGSAEVKVQQPRTQEGAEVQFKVGKVGSGVSQAERIEDRNDQRIDKIQLPAANSVPTVPSTGTPRMNILGAPIAGTWSAAPERTLTPWIYKFQDKQIDLKDAQKQIEKTVGKIDDALNAYRKETLYYGRVADQTERFLTEELKPLLKDMMDKKLTLDEVDKYLQALHAEERNKSIAKRINGMPDGGAGLSTADAQAYLSSLSPDKARDLKDISDRVRKIIAGTQAIEVNGGLELQSKIDGWNKAWPNYVPLFRDEVDYVNSGSGMGQGFSVRGSSSKRAVGSDKPVKEIIASLAEQRQKAIVRTEKARVGKALYALAIANPNPDYWLAIDPNSKEDIKKVEQMLQDYGFDPGDIAQLIQNMAQEPRTGTVKRVFNPVTKQFDEVVKYDINTQNRYSSNVLPVRINGEDKFLFFNPSNERAKRMAESIKNLDAEQLGEVTQTIGNVTRFIAAMSTQYNPIFGAWNFARDVQGAALNLSTTPLKDKKAEVVAGAFKAMKGIYAEARARRSGKQASGYYSDLYRDFESEGGKTGFINQFNNLNKKGTIVERELKGLTQGKIKGAASAVGNWLSDYNDTLENAVRLSAYEQGIKMGLSKEEAAEIAKNLTVNFNRKGAKTAGLGALYAFFNSSVQGTARLYETLRGPAGKKIIAGGFLLGAFQAALLAMAGFDEDEPSEFIKQKNFVIPTLDGGYIMVPMPLGFNILPNVGRIISEIAFGNKKSASRKVGDLMEAVVSSFNPLGGGNMVQMAMPTVLDPIANVIINRDSFGRPISREDRAMNPSPGYLRSRESAGVVAKGIAEFLNYVSGGTEFNKGAFSPTGDDINYIVGQYLGGVGRELMRAKEFVTSIGKEEPFEPYKVPVLGKVYGDINAPASVANKFYLNVKQMAEHENEIKGRKGSAISEYMRENPDARLYRTANRLENDISKLNKTKKQLLEKDAPEAAIRRIEDQKLRMMKQFNDQVRKLQ